MRAFATFDEKVRKCYLDLRNWRKHIWVWRLACIGYLPNRTKPYDLRPLDVRCYWKCWTLRTLPCCDNVYRSRIRTVTRYRKTSKLFKHFNELLTDGTCAIPTGASVSTAENQHCRRSMFALWTWVSDAWPCANWDCLVVFRMLAMPSSSLPLRIAKIESDDLLDEPNVAIPSDRKPNRPFRVCKWRLPHDSRHPDILCCPFHGARSHVSPSRCQRIQCHWLIPLPVYYHWRCPSAVRGWHSRVPVICTRHLLPAKTTRRRKLHPSVLFSMLGWIVPVHKHQRINFETTSIYLFTDGMQQTLASTHIMVNNRIHSPPLGLRFCSGRRPIGCSCHISYRICAFAESSFSTARRCCCFCFLLIRQSRK